MPEPTAPPAADADHDAAQPGPGRTTQDNAPSPPQDPPHNAFRDRSVFRVGVVVGIALAATALAFNALSLGAFSFQTVVLCVGLGIILGAFGSLATAKIPIAGATVSGAAAIALVFFSLLNSGTDKGFLVIRVTGDVAGAELLLRGDETFHGRRFSNNEQEFVIIGDDIRIRTLKLEYIPADETGERILFNCIMRDMLRAHLGSGNILEWTLVTDEPRLINTVSGDLVSDAFTLTCASPGARERALPAISSLFGTLPSLIPSAHAQTTQTTTAPSADQLVRGLQQDSFSQRQIHREDLTHLGVTAVRPLLDSLHQRAFPSKSSLTDALSTLHDIAKADDATAAEVARVLTERDRALLIESLGADERAVRFLASDLLFITGGPNAVVSIVKALPSLNANGRNNALVVGTATAAALDRTAANRATAEIDAIVRSGRLDSNALSIASRVKASLPN